MLFWDLLPLICVVAGLVLIGTCKGKNAASEGTYLVADRRTGLFALTATLVMTEINTATLVSFASAGYGIGGWALALPLVFLIGLGFYALVAAKKWHAFKGMSVASFFTKRYGKDIGRLASIALLTAMAGFSAAYVKSLYLLFHPIFPMMNEWVLTAFLVILVLAMTIRGGLLSVIYTDAASFVITCLFFPLMAFFSFQAIPIHQSGEMSSAASIQQLVSELFSQAGEGLPVRFVVSLIILTMFTYILAPWYGQKIFAARSSKVAYLSVALAAVIVFLIYALAVISTLFLKSGHLALASPEHALPYVVDTILPAGVRGVGYGLLFAASATTLTGVWSAMAAMLIADFLPVHQSGSNARAKAATIAFACVSYLLANILVDKVFDKLILANIPVAALSFALLGGFYWKKSSRGGAYLSMLIGWAWGIGSFAYWGEAGGYTWYWAMGGIPLIFAAGVIGSYCLPDKRSLNYAQT